jgi:hypothetical protein
MKFAPECLRDEMKSWRAHYNCTLLKRIIVRSLYP